MVFRAWGSRFGEEKGGACFAVWVLGSRFWSMGFGFWGVVFRVWCFGLRRWGAGFGEEKGVASHTIVFDDVTCPCTFTW